MLGSICYPWYVARFGRCDATYGSLGAVIGLVTWVWLSAIVVLSGAELDAELELRLEQERDGSTAPSAGAAGE